MKRRRRTRKHKATEKVHSDTDAPVAKKRKVIQHNIMPSKLKNSSKESKKIPYHSIEDYFYNESDSDHISKCNRMTLRHHISHKIFIAPLNNNRWSIEFVENRLNFFQKEDKKQIKTLAEHAFNKPYAKYCLQIVNGDPIRFVLLRDHKKHIISFLIYSQKRMGFIFVIKTVVTDMKYRGKGLGSMCILALQYKLIRRQLHSTHKLYAEVALDAISFWNKNYLNMMEIKDKRRLILDTKMKRRQNVCEFMWMTNVKQTENKLLEYLQRYHVSPP